MKVIRIDNFARENVSDKLVCENVSHYYGEIITKYLNENFSGENSPDFYKLVDDDYKLYVFEY